MVYVGVASWAQIALVGLIGALTYVLSRLVQERRFYRNKPGPPHHWLWGHLKIMGQIMAEFPPGIHHQVVVTTMMHKYHLPRLFYIDLWPFSCGQLVVADPDIALHITVTKNHPKHEAEKMFIDPLVGPGNIVTSEGSVWKYLHQMLSPAFAIQHISNMRPAIAEEFMELRSMLHDKAKSGEIFKFEEMTLHTTFDVIGKAAFGQSLNAKTKGSAVLQHWEKMSRAFQAYHESWNFYNNWFNKKIVREESKELNFILTKMIKQRFDILIHDKTDLSNRKGLGIMDLILRDYIAETRLSAKQGLDQAFIDTSLSQIKALLIAGTSTTSDTVCFMMMLLSVHPEVVRKLREEHDTVFEKGIDATYEMLKHEPYKLNDLEYTTNVAKEVLRLYPIGSTARGQHATEKHIEYQGQLYPTGDRLIIPSAMTIHLNGEIFKDPMKFDPDRFSRKDFPRHAWRPFERGPRSCLGQSLAMDELKLMLLLTIRDFDFTCADIKPNKTPRTSWVDWDLVFGDRAFQEYVFEARPRDGMPMTVKKSDWAV